MYQKNKDLLVSEITGYVEEGVTNPLRCRLSDDSDVIAKYLSNPCGKQVLVNEYVSARIADAIGLNVPRFGFCKLTSELISTSSTTDLLYCNNIELEEGYIFYSKELKNAIPVSAGQLIIRDLDDFQIEKMLLFDWIIGNKDRHIGNLLIDLSKNKNTIYVIDHGTLFTTTNRYSLEDLKFEIDNDNIDLSFLISNSETYSVLLKKFSIDSDVLKQNCGIIVKHVNMEFLNKIKSEMPQLWIDRVGEDLVDCLFELINKRASLVFEMGELLLPEIGRSF